jgi:hypothetical protein
VHDLLEGVGHATADDDFVGLLQQILDQRDLVRDLRPAQNGEQRTLRMLQHRRERLQFSLHQEARRLLRQVDPDDRGMRAVGGAERIVHVHIPQSGETGAERVDGRLVGLERRAILELHLALLLDVETQVLQQQHLAGA